MRSDKIGDELRSRSGLERPVDGQAGDIPLSTIVEIEYNSPKPKNDNSYKVEVRII